MTNEELVKLIQSGIDTTKNMELLYIQNEPFIMSVAHRYDFVCHINNKRKRELDKIDEKPYPIGIIEFNELLQEAYFGLVKAAYGYDPSVGKTFLSYAAYWIRQAILRFIENSGRFVRVPVHTQQKIYQYNQVSRHYLSKFGREPSTSELATCLYMTVKQVEKLQLFMFQRTVLSLDTPISEEAETEETYIETIADNVNVEQEVIEGIASEQLTVELWNVVDIVLKNDTMIEILRLRHVDGLTLEQTSDRLGLHRESVRNLENKALRRLRNNSKTKNLKELIA